MNPWTDVKENGVTTAAIATVKLTNVSVKGTYKALVLLNNNTKDDKTKKVTLPTSGVTYTTWSEDASNANAVNYAKDNHDDSKGKYADNGGGYRFKELFHDMSILRYLLESSAKIVKKKQIPKLFVQNHKKMMKI